MQPNNVDPNSVLWKGCLGGVGLTVLFFAVSGITYLAASSMELPRNILLLVSIASGPIVGTIVLILFAFWLASRQKPGPPPKRIYRDDDDE